MTLIELLVVVVIVGVLSAIASTQFFSAVRRARVNRTLAELRSVMTAIDIYMIDHDNYPIHTDFISLGDVLTGDGLTHYYRGAVKDAWGMPFRYRTDVGGRHYMIKSFGADKIHNATTGDFVNPESWVGSACRNISIRAELEVVSEKGCDIVFLNGKLAEKFE